MTHLHREGIVHRDLAARDSLVCPGGRRVWPQPGYWSAHEGGRPVGTGQAIEIIKRRVADRGSYAIYSTQKGLRSASRSKLEIMESIFKQEDFASF